MAVIMTSLKETNNSSFSIFFHQTWKGGLCILPLSWWFFVNMKVYQVFKRVKPVIGLISRQSQLSNENVKSHKQKVKLFVS